MRHLRHLTAVFALAGLCCPQDQPAPFALVPKDACAVLRVAGPAVWRDRFAKTQVQKLLLGPTAQPLRQELGRGFDEAMEAARKDGSVDVDLLRQVFTDYAGELVVALQVDFDGIATAIQQEKPPPMVVVVALTADGKSDLAAVCAQAEKTAERNGTALRDLTVGELKLRVATDDDLQISLPTMHDGHLVWFAGTALEDQLGKLLAARREAPAAAKAPAPLSLHLDLAAGVTALLQAVALAAEQGGAPFDIGKLLNDLGFGSLEGLDLSLDADGRYVAVDANLALNDKDRGLLAMGLVPATGLPAIARLLPPGADTFSVSHVDLGAAYRTVAKIWDGLGDQVPMSRADGETAFAEQFKVRLKEDLLDHLGNELLMVQDLREALDAQVAAGKDGSEADAMAAAFSAYCFAISLQDGKAFGESMEKLVRARGMHAGRKTEEYAGAKVHRLKLLGLVDLEYCITEDLLLLAFGQGEAARQHLRGVLDERRNRAAGNKPPDLPATVKERLALVPEGCTGFGATSVSALLSAFSTTLTAVAASTGGNPEAESLQQVLEVVGSLQGEMRQLGLDHMLSAQKAEKNGFRFYFRW